LVDFARSGPRRINCDPSAILPFAIMGGDTVKGSDWIGIAGSIVGSAVTLTAAVIAWFAVKRQINVAREVAIIRENETWSDVVAKIDYVWRNIDRVSLRTDKIQRLLALCQVSIHWQLARLGSIALSKLHRVPSSSRSAFP
jgi:hypothetical protein